MATFKSQIERIENNVTQILDWIILLHFGLGGTIPREHDEHLVNVPDESPVEDNAIALINRLHEVTDELHVLAHVLVVNSGEEMLSNSEESLFILGLGLDHLE